MADISDKFLKAFLLVKIFIKTFQNFFLLDLKMLRSFDESSY